MALRPCLSCGRLIKGASRCAECQRAVWRAKNATRDPFARRLYGSVAWRRLAEGVIAEATGCAYCGTTDAPLTADHVLGVRCDPSRALDPTNVVAACRSCQERRKHNPAWSGGRRAS